MSDINPAKPVQKTNDIDDCPDERTLPRGSSILMVGGDSSKPATFTPQFVALPFNPLRADPNFRTWWNPDVNDFNQMAAVLRRLGWKSVCRQGEGERPELIVSKTVGKPTGIFGSCSEPNAALDKKQLELSLTPTVAKYIASKFPTSTETVDGCSSVKEDGRIYYKIKADWGAIKIARDGIWDDMKAEGGKGKFPPGVDKATVRKIADFLLEIAKQDPNVAMKANAKEQMDAMRDNVRTQLGVTVVIQLASTGLFAGFFYKQLQVTKKMMEQMGEQLGNVKWEEVARDLVEVERQKMKDSPAAIIHDTDAEALEYLRRIARPKRGHVFLVGPSGSGKDTIVRRAAQLLALKDPRIMAEPTLRALIGKPLWYVDPTLLQAKGGVVGSGAKVMKLARAALIKGEPVYWPELAQGLTAFTHSKGSSESPAVLLKTILDEVPRGFSGSAVPGDYQQMAESGLIGDPKQFERRVPAMWVKAKPYEQVVKIIKEHTAPAIAKQYGISIASDILDTILQKTVDALKASGEFEDTPLFDAIESRLMDACDHAQSKGATALTREHINEIFARPKAYSARNGGVHADEAHASAVPDPVAQIRAQQVRILSEHMMRMPEFMGHADIISEVAELAYERLSGMSSRAKGNPEKFKRTLMRCKKKVLAKRAGGGPGDPGAPPTAGAPAAGGASAGTGGAAPAGTASARDAMPEATVLPWVDMPAGMAGSSIPVEDGFGARIVWDAAAEQVRGIIPEQTAAATGADGRFYTVAVDATASAETPKVTAGYRPPIQMLPPDQQAKLGVYSGVGFEAFGHLTVGGLAGGAAALTLIHAYEDSHGRHLPWYGEMGVFLGAGVGISAGQAVLTGQSVTAVLNPTALVGGFLVSAPASFASFGAASFYGDMVGFEQGTRGNQWFSVGVGSVLVAGAMTAKLPVLGTSAAALGLCGKAALAGGVAGLAVGAAAVAGGLIGRGIDKGLGAAGLKSTDGDRSFSGWVSEKIYKGTHGGDYAPIRVKLKNPIR